MGFTTPYTTRRLTSRLGKYIRDVAEQLQNTRPTAINLAHALERVITIEPAEEIEEMVQLALQTANAITEESIEHCRPSASTA